MSIRSAVDNISRDQGFAYIHQYFDPDQPFSGASFETLDAARSPANEFTGSDLYALECLAVDVPIAAGIDILGARAEEINELLAQIPNTALGSLSEEEFNHHLGPSSAAMKLWKILFSYRNIGATRASKLMARKRPHLIPVYDSVIRKVVGYSAKEDDWTLWWEALTEDNELECRAQELRDSINRPDLSILRTLDVMLWMSGRKQ